MHICVHINNTSIKNFFCTDYNLDPYIVLACWVSRYVSFLPSCQPTMGIPTDSSKMERNYYDENYPSSITSLTVSPPDFQIVVNLMNKPSSSTYILIIMIFKIMHIPMLVPSSGNNMMIFQWWDGTYAEYTTSITPPTTRMNPKILTTSPPKRRSEIPILGTIQKVEPETTRRINYYQKKKRNKENRYNKQELQQREQLHEQEWQQPE